MPVLDSQSGPQRGLQGQPGIPRHDTVDKYWKYLGSDADGEALFQYVVLRRDLQADRNWPLGAIVSQAIHAAVAAGVEGLLVGDEITRDYLQAPPGSKHLAVLENSYGESGCVGSSCSEQMSHTIHVTIAFSARSEFFKHHFLLSRGILHRLVLLQTDDSGQQLAIIWHQLPRVAAATWRRGERCATRLHIGPLRVSSCRFAQNNQCSVLFQSRQLLGLLRSPRSPHGLRVKRACTLSLSGFRSPPGIRLQSQIGRTFYPSSPRKA